MSPLWVVCARELPQPTQKQGLPFCNWHEGDVEGRGRYSPGGQGPSW